MADPDLVFPLTAEEVKEHFAARVLYHLERAAAYEKDMNSVLTQRIEASSTSFNNPADQLRAQRDGHLRSAKKFDFLAKHVDLKAHYPLSMNQLSNLEFF